jgi:hypothetical protein
MTIKAKFRVKGYRIQLIDISSDQVTKEFSSIREAARELKAAQNTIKQAIESGHTPIGVFKWLLRKYDNFAS